MAVPAGWVTRAFFALADNHGVLLRGLQRDDEDLEELFHRVTGGATAERTNGWTPVMGALTPAAWPPELLHYRPWRGDFRPPAAASGPSPATALAHDASAASCSGSCTPWAC